MNQIFLDLRLCQVYTQKLNPRHTCPTSTRAPSTMPPTTSYQQTMALYDLQISDCFTVETGTKPEAADGQWVLKGAEQNLNKYVNVLDGTFHIYADEDVADIKILYVASVIASILDPEGKGSPKSTAFADVLKANYAHIVICGDRKDIEDRCGYYTSHYRLRFTDDKYLQPNGEFISDHAALLYEDEIWPSKIGQASRNTTKMFEDKTLFAVYRNLHRFGLAKIKPERFGIGGGSTLHAGLVKAWGSVDFQNGVEPSQFGRTAWFKYVDSKCSYKCQHETYFAFTVINLLGGQEIQSGYPEICQVYDACRLQTCHSNENVECDELITKSILTWWEYMDTHDYTKSLLSPKADYNGCKVAMAYSFNPARLPTQPDEEDKRSCWYDKIETVESQESYLGKYIQIADCFKVFAETSVDNSYLAYVASVASSMLDKNRDNQCDVADLKTQLSDNGAHIAIFSQGGFMYTPLLDYATNFASITGGFETEPAILYVPDIKDIQRQLPWKNPTVERLLQAMVRFGLEPGYQWAFSRTIINPGPGAEPSLLTSTTDKLRGGHKMGDASQEVYPKNAYYKNRDANCDYKCQTERLLVYSLILLQGTFRDEDGACWNEPLMSEFPKWEETGCTVNSINDFDQQYSVMMTTFEKFGDTFPSYYDAVRSLMEKPKDDLCPPVMTEIIIPPPVKGYPFQTCFKVESVPANSPLGAPGSYFQKYISLFDGVFDIYAEEGVSDDKIQYVAAVASSMLDRFEDGKVLADKNLGTTLKNNKAHIVICHDENTAYFSPNCHNYRGHYHDAYPDEVMPSGAQLWDNQIDIRNAFELPNDWTQFQLIRAFFRYGLASLDDDFSAVFDIKEPTPGCTNCLSKVIESARDGKDSDFRGVTQGGYFVMADNDCNYRCMAERFIAWHFVTATQIIKQQETCAVWPEIQQEWRLCNAKIWQGGPLFTFAQSWFHSAFGTYKWRESISKNNQLDNPKNRPDYGYDRFCKESSAEEASFSIESADAGVLRGCWVEETAPTSGEEPFSFHGGMRMIELFGGAFRIFADDNVPADRFSHVASVAASLLDKPVNGVRSGDVYNADLKAALLANPGLAYITVFKNADSDKLTDFVNLNNQSPTELRTVIFSDDIKELYRIGHSRHDPTLDRVLRKIFHSGFAKAWPSAFGQTGDTKSQLTLAVEEALGATIDTELPKLKDDDHLDGYPNSATYKPNFNEIPCRRSASYCYHDDLFVNTWLMIGGYFSGICHENWVNDVYNWHTYGGCNWMPILNKQAALANIFGLTAAGQDNAWYDAITILQYGAQVNGQYCPQSSTPTPAPTPTVSICEELRIQPRPPLVKEPPLYHLLKYVHVFDTFWVFAEESVDDNKINYVTRIVAKLIDPDRSGQPAFPDLADKLDQSRAHIAIFNKKSVSSEAYTTYVKYYHKIWNGEPEVNTPAVLFADDINVGAPSQLGKDKTVRQVVKNFVRFGWGQFDVFKTDKWGNGGSFTVSMRNAINAGTFKDDDCKNQSDETRCLIESYFSVGFATLHGGTSQNGCAEEWESDSMPQYKVCGKELNVVDTGMNDFLTNFPQSDKSLRSLYSQPPNPYDSSCWPTTDGAMTIAPPTETTTTTTTTTPVTMALYDAQISDCFEILDEKPFGQLSNAAQEMQKYVNVFGVFKIFADSRVLDGKVRYVAAVVSSFLDFNRDGKIDDAAFGQKLTEEQAHVVICFEDDDKCQYYTEHYHLAFPNDQYQSPEGFKNDHAALLYQNEVQPSQLGKTSKSSDKLFEDKTLFVIYRNFHRFGLAPYNPTLYGVGGGSALHVGLVTAWGGQNYETPPSTFYGTNAWYKNLDRNCNYRCQHEQFFAYTALMHLGEQQIQNGFPRICDVYDACNNRLLRNCWAEDPTLECDLLIKRRILDGPHTVETHSYTKGLGKDPDAAYSGCRRLDDTAVDASFIAMTSSNMISKATQCLSNRVNTKVPTYATLKSLAIGDCFTVYAGGNVGDKYLLHAARIAGNYLDPDQNGRCDKTVHKTLAQKLKDNKAHVALFTNASSATYHAYWTDINPELFGPESGYGKEAVIFTEDVVVDDHNVYPPVQGPPRTDSTSYNIIRNILRFGLAKAWPSVFGLAFDSGSTLSQAVDHARGGRYEETLVPPKRYPSGATFTNYDSTCDYSCQAYRLFSYSVLQVSGIFNEEKYCDNQQIEDEFHWKKLGCGSAQNVEQRNKALATVLARESSWRGNGGTQPEYFEFLKGLWSKPTQKYCQNATSWSGTTVSNDIGIAIPFSSTSNSFASSFYNIQQCEAKNNITEVSLIGNDLDDFKTNGPGDSTTTSGGKLWDATKQFKKWIGLFPHENYKGGGIKEWPFHIFIEEGVDASKVKYFAAKAASMLDRNEDGIIDSSELADKLIANRAHIVICHRGSNNGQCSTYYQHYQYIFYPEENVPDVEKVWPSQAFIYDDEIDPAFEENIVKDKTMFKLMRAFIRYGIAKLDNFSQRMDIYEDKSKTTPNDQFILSRYMSRARGFVPSDQRGSFGSVTPELNYVWYTNTKSANDCNYRCFIEEYITIMTLWKQEPAPGSNKNVMETSCKADPTLGGMFTCVKEMGTGDAKWKKNFQANEYDNDVVELMASKFNDKNYNAAWRKGLMKFPDANYGHCESQEQASQTYGIYGVSPNAAEDYATHLQQQCNGFRIEQDPDNENFKQIKVFQDTFVRAEENVKDSTLLLVSSILGSMFDREYNGEPTFINPGVYGQKFSLDIYESSDTDLGRQQNALTIFEDQISDRTFDNLVTDPTLWKIITNVYKQTLSVQSDVNCLALTCPGPAICSNTDCQLYDAMQQAKDDGHYTKIWEDGECYLGDDTDSIRQCDVEYYFTGTVLFLQGLMRNVCHKPAIRDVFHWHRLGGCSDPSVIIRHQPIMSDLLTLDGWDSSDKTQGLHLIIRQPPNAHYCPNRPTPAPPTETTDCLEVTPIPRPTDPEPGTYLLHGAEQEFKKQVDVLGTFRVFAEEEIPDKTILYVASIVATSLDWKQNKKVDDPILQEKLLQNKAHIVICEERHSAGCEYYLSHYKGMLQNELPAVLLHREINSGHSGHWGKDLTIINVVRNIYKFGISKLHSAYASPEDPEDGQDASSLQEKMEESVTKGYFKPSSHCKFSDKDCQVQLYFAVAALTMKKRLTENMCTGTDLESVWNICGHDHWNNEPLLMNGGEWFREATAPNNNWPHDIWKHGIIWGDTTKPDGKYEACEVGPQQMLALSENCFGDQMKVEPLNDTDPAWLRDNFNKVNVFDTITIYGHKDFPSVTNNDNPLKWTGDIVANLLVHGQTGRPEAVAAMKALTETLKKYKARLFLLTKESDKDDIFPHEVQYQLDTEPLQFNNPPFVVYPEDVGPKSNPGRPGLDRTLMLVYATILQYGILEHKESWFQAFNPYTLESDLSLALVDAKAKQTVGSVENHYVYVPDKDCAITHCQHNEIFGWSIIAAAGGFNGFQNEPKARGVLNLLDKYDRNNWQAIMPKMHNLLYNQDNDWYYVIFKLTQLPASTYCRYGGTVNTADTSIVAGTTAAPATAVTPAYEGDEKPDAEYFACKTAPNEDASGIPGTNMFGLYISLFDDAFRIFADADVSCKKVQHVAALVSDMLDRDQNNQVDKVRTDAGQDSLDSYLRQNKAHMVICKTNDDNDEACNEYKKWYHLAFESCEDERNPAVKNKPYVIREYDIDLANPGVLTTDKTVFVAILNIFRFGLQFTSPSMFKTRCKGVLPSGPDMDARENWSALRIAAQLARGDPDGENYGWKMPDEINYPAPKDGVHTAWYTNRDHDCNMRCQIETYFAWHVYHTIIGQPSQNIRLGRNKDNIQCDPKITYQWNTCYNEGGWHFDQHDIWAQSPLYDSVYDDELKKNIFYIPEGFMQTPSVLYLPEGVEPAESDDTDEVTIQPETGEMMAGCEQPIKITATPSDAPAYAYPALMKHVKLFDGKFNIYAQKSVTNDKILHVAYVMAGLIDGDMDGEADNDFITDAFEFYNAHIAIFKTEVSFSLSA